MEESADIADGEEPTEDFMVKIESIVSAMDDTKKMIFGGVAIVILLLLICCICKCCLMCRRKRMEKADRQE